MRYWNLYLFFKKVKRKISFIVGMLCKIFPYCHPPYLDFSLQSWGAIFVYIYVYSYCTYMSFVLMPNMSYVVKWCAGLFSSFYVLCQSFSTVIDICTPHFAGCNFTYIIHIVHVIIPSILAHSHTITKCSSSFENARFRNQLC